MGWDALVRLLKIKHVFELIMYDERKSNPFRFCCSLDEDDGFSKYNIYSFMSDDSAENFENFTKEKRVSVFKWTIQQIFKFIIDEIIVIKCNSGNLKSNLINNEQDENILILCPNLHTNMIDYSVKYFCNQMYNGRKKMLKKEEIRESQELTELARECDIEIEELAQISKTKNPKLRECLKFIDIYQIDFIRYEAFIYNKLNYTLDSYRSAIWKNRNDDDISYDCMEQQGKPIWHNLFKYESNASGIYMKKCGMLENIYSFLEDWGVCELNFFDEKFFPKIIANRNAREKRIIEQQKQEQEQEMYDNWEQLGKDEMESWDRNFPNWQWNID